MWKATMDLPVVKTRLCAVCGAALPDGVAEVFCPVCAFRGALARGGQPGEGTLLRWFRQLTRRSGAKNGEKSLDPARADRRSSGAMATAPEPGEVIGDYELLEQLGGNMGLVFKARHRLLDKVLALKLVPADWMADPVRRARFQREMRVMGQLEHPNLVPAADARNVGQWHLVTMEFIDGVDLQQLARNRSPLPIPMACEAARQAATGLQYAHEHGLIHRDIKPSNLMLTRSGTVKVIDMGLALVREDSSAQVTQSGLVVGTMGYCAPEQFRNASSVDIRADIYSLGCTLYHLLAGKAPFSNHKTMAEVVEAHLHEAFPPLLQARPDAPPELEAILARMTAKDRMDRFSTPSEVVAALEPFAGGADLKPLVPSRPDQNPLALPDENRLSQKPKTQGFPNPRLSAVLMARRPELAAAVVILLLLVVTALFVAAALHKRTGQNQTLSALVSEPAAGLAERDPVVVLMDTTAPTGVYDADNRATGGSNAKEVSKALVEMGILPSSSLHPVSIFAGWAGESFVISLRPHLIVVHRSAFHHSYNAVLNLGSTNNGFAHPADDPSWRFSYNEIGDDKLICLLGYISAKVPQCKFLVYSRGTDTNWLRTDFQKEWIKKVSARFKELEGKIRTMVIPNGYSGSFRQTTTREILASNVVSILNLPQRRRDSSPSSP